MKIKKIFVIIIMFIFIMGQTNQLHAQAELFIADQNELEDLQNLTAVESAISNDMLLAFSALQIFLEGINKDFLDANNQMTSSRQSAFEFLQLSFAAKLADDLISTYSYWDPRLQKLMVIPQESIPLVDSADTNRLNFIQFDDNNYLVEIKYYNCYITSDDCLYQIYMRKEKERWKVLALRLIPMVSPWKNM